MRVCVLNRDKTPLGTCERGKARRLLRQGKAVIHRYHPFVIRLKSRVSTALLDELDPILLPFKSNPRYIHK